MQRTATFYFFPWRQTFLPHQKRENSALHLTTTMLMGLRNEREDSTALVPLFLASSQFAFNGTLRLQQKHFRTHFIKLILSRSNCMYPRQAPLMNCLRHCMQRKMRMNGILFLKG